MTEVIGIIKNCRLGSRTQKPTQYVIIVEGYNKTKASALIGKRVVWTTSSKKQILGKITNVHGNNGALTAKFSKGLPGQAIGTNVIIK